MSPTHKNSTPSKAGKGAQQNEVKPQTEQKDSKTRPSFTKSFSTRLPKKPTRPNFSKSFSKRFNSSKSSRQIITSVDTEENESEEKNDSPATSERPRMSKSFSTVFRSKRFGLDDDDDDHSILSDLISNLEQETQHLDRRDSFKKMNSISLSQNNFNIENDFTKNKSPKDNLKADNNNVIDVENDGRKNPPTINDHLCENIEEEKEPEKTEDIEEGKNPGSDESSKRDAKAINVNDVRKKSKFETMTQSYNNFTEDYLDELSSNDTWDTIFSRTACRVYILFVLMFILCSMTLFAIKAAESVKDKHEVDSQNFEGTIPPVPAGLEEICGINQIDNRNVQECEKICSPASCCWDLTWNNCHEDNRSICRDYWPCSNLMPDDAGTSAEPVNDITYLLDPEVVKNLLERACDESTFVNVQNYDNCRNLCSPRICCFDDVNSCKDTKKDECDAFHACKNIISYQT